MMGAKRKARTPSMPRDKAPRSPKPWDAGQLNREYDAGPWQFDSPTYKLTDADFADIEREGGIVLSQQHRNALQDAIDFCIRDYRFDLTERPHAQHPDRVKVGKLLHSIVTALDTLENNLALDQLTAAMIFLGPAGRELTRHPNSDVANAYRRQIHEIGEELIRLRILVTPLAERAMAGIADPDVRKRGNRPPMNTHLRELAWRCGLTYRDAGGNAGTGKDYDRPFAKFLKVMWSRLPRTYRGRSEQGIVEAYNDVIHDKNTRLKAEATYQKRHASRQKRQSEDLISRIAGDIADAWDASPHRRRRKHTPKSR